MFSSFAPPQSTREALPIYTTAKTLVKWLDMLESPRRRINTPAQEHNPYIPHSPSNNPTQTIYIPFPHTLRSSLLTITSNHTLHLDNRRLFHCPFTLLQTNRSTLLPRDLDKAHLPSRAGRRGLSRAVSAILVSDPGPRRGTTAQQPRRLRLANAGRRRAG